MATNRPELTRIFASPLQRANKTANALASAQFSGNVTVTSVAALVEQDFGYYEGKPFQARPRDSSKSGKDAHREAHKNDPGFVDVESRDSLASRSDLFLDDHLLPLVADEAEMGGEAEHVVAIVSHGILLSHLWRRLLLRLQPKSVTVASEIIASRGQLVLEHLGGWSNTGFLELSIQPAESENGSMASKGGGSSIEGSDVNVADAESKRSKTCTVSSIDVPPSNTPGESSELPASQSDHVGDVSVAKGDADSQPPEKTASKILDGYRTTILVVDGKQHLVGLKRTRGGIGRAEHDEKQKTMDSFFKRARKD